MFIERIFDISDDFDKLSSTKLLGSVSVDSECNSNLPGMSSNSSSFRFSISVNPSTSSEDSSIISIGYFQDSRKIRYCLPYLPVEITRDIIWNTIFLNYQIPIIIKGIIEFSVKVVNTYLSVEFMSLLDYLLYQDLFYYDLKN